MRTLWVILLFTLAKCTCGAATVADPAPAVANARDLLRERIVQQSAGRIVLLNFTSDSGPKPAPWDNDGERRFLITYRADIEFAAPCVWDISPDQGPVSFKTHEPGTLAPAPHRILVISQAGERFRIQGQIALKGNGTGWEATGFTWSDPPEQIAWTETPPVPEPVVPNHGGASRYPSASLESELLKVQFYLPDGEHGYYRGTRFDWSGLISSVDYAGHRFFSEFKKEHDPLNHDDICGTAEEFGINDPPGYREAAPGGVFLKVGIGLLEKPDDEPYSFAKRYRVAQEARWQVQRDANRLEFRQEFTGSDGWGYSYKKTVEIDPHAPVVRVRRILENTGTRPIVTDHYCHNFLKIDDLAAGPGYAIEFPFAIKLGEGSRLQGCVEVRDRALVFLKEIPQTDSVWLRIEGFATKEDNRITLRNQRTGAWMNIVTDQPASRMAFFSQGGVLSPEPFVEVKIPPGTTKTWTTTYTFNSGNER